MQTFLKPFKKLAGRVLLGLFQLVCFEHIHGYSKYGA